MATLGRWPEGIPVERRPTTHPGGGTQQGGGILPTSWSLRHILPAGLHSEGEAGTFQEPAWLRAWSGTTVIVPPTPKRLEGLPKAGIGGHT